MILKKAVNCEKNPKKRINGFGLIDAILSLSLLAGIITYGVYFSSLRLNTVYSSNIIRSVNKEIERDIERFKLELWSLFFDKSQSKYIISEIDCDNLTDSILNLSSIKTNKVENNQIIKSWRPGAERSKVFTGENILISRALNISEPVEGELLNNSLITLDYSVEWGDNNIHWLSIDLTPEAHSWCKQDI
tara:strand:- start:143 stop:712 length:570 start_codon:yes stop_codon:yes gene_type:complete